jgi:hypothetical protein
MSSIPARFPASVALSPEISATIASVSHDNAFSAGIEEDISSIFPKKSDFPASANNKRNDCFYFARKRLFPWIRGNGFFNFAATPGFPS